MTTGFCSRSDRYPAGENSRTNGSNINPLTGLTNLTSVGLSGNQISDIDALAGMTELRQLVLLDNHVSNLQPVSGLTKLWWLHLGSNQINDIDALAGLTNLELLHLDNNQIGDTSPLLLNDGLGSGDQVWLRDNPLSDTSINEYIPALEERGVQVYY